MTITGLRGDQWENARGHSISVMMLSVRCDGEGDYSFLIETKDLADGDATGIAPTVPTAATCVGRADGYVVAASVRLVATQAVSIFGYTNSGRAYVNNFQPLGQPAASVSLLVDSLSNNPGSARAQQ